MVEFVSKKILILQGINTFGQVGDGTTNSRRRSLTTKLISIEIILIPYNQNLTGKVLKHVSETHGTHVLAITTDGILYAWGNNSKVTLWR
jgi:alpha-tubulin suppressor-like RCC1 family protein